MRSPIVFYLAIALVIIGIAVGVYYLIPGFHHIIIFSLHQGTDTFAARPLHAVVGFIVAVVGVVLVFLARPKKAAAA
jgi:hypothetical protein